MLKFFVSPFTLIILVVLLHSNSRADEAARDLILSSYKLANPKSTATGFVVKKNKHFYLITAHHVLQKMEGTHFTLVSRQEKAKGVYHREEIRIQLRKEGKDLWVKHTKHDIAVLELPANLNLVALPFECLPTEDSMANIHVGDEVRSAVFPEKTEANGAGFPLMRHGVIAGFPLHPIQHNPMFQIHTTSWAGDSGGPVILHAPSREGGVPIVIGVIQGLLNITDTTKESRFVERKMHYPLDLSEVVNAYFARELILKEFGQK